MSCRSKT